VRKSLLKFNLENIPYFIFSLSFLINFFYILQNIFYGDDLLVKLYFCTGFCALLFFNLSIFFSLFHFDFSRNYPKFFGLFGAIWLFMHFLFYFIFSKNLSFVKLFNDVSSRVFEGSGFLALIIIFLMTLSSFSFFKSLAKIRKLGFFALLLGSWHYFLSAENPYILEYFFLALASFYCILRYSGLKSRFLKQNIRSV